MWIWVNFGEFEFGRRWASLNFNEFNIILMWDTLCEFEFAIFGEWDGFHIFPPFWCFGAVKRGIAHFPFFSKKSHFFRAFWNLKIFWIYEKITNFDIFQNFICDSFCFLVLSIPLHFVSFLPCLTLGLNSRSMFWK